MQKYILTLLIFVVLAATAGLAQEKTGAPPDTAWKHSLVSGLSLTQVSYTNWSKGGENSLAYTLSLDGTSRFSSAPSLWENQYRFAYGEARLGKGQGLRKTEDIIDLGLHEYLMDFLERISTLGDEISRHFLVPA